MPASSQIGFVLAIEGYDRLLTDTLDTAAVEEAWGGTGWTQALAGLKVRGTIRQSIQPWARSLDVPTLTFEVQATGDDRFGKDVWRSRPAYRSNLRSPFRPNADGTGTLDVDSTVDTEGQDLFIGGQRLQATQAGPNTYDVTDVGLYNPFEAIVGSRFFRVIDMPAMQGYDAAVRPYVSSTPTAWIGRKVALYRHTIKGGRWNLRSAAVLEFAGRIVSLKDDPKTGATIIGCEDLRSLVRDAMLFKRQWIGRVRRGVRLEAGWAFYALEQRTSGTQTLHWLKAPLIVVGSGAAGNFEINSGYHELGDFVAKLNSYVASTQGWGSNSTPARWSVGLEASSSGSTVLAIRAKHQIDIQNFEVRFYCTDRQPLQFLGFDWGGSNGMERGTDQEGIGVDRAWPYLFARTAQQTQPELLIESPIPPYVVKPFQSITRWSETGARVDLEGQDGEWVEHEEYLPSPYDEWPEPGESWSFLKMGDRLFFGRYQGTFLSDVTRTLNFAGYAEVGTPEQYKIGKTVEDDEDRLDVEQVVVLVGSFADLMTKFLVSTDGRGVNHPTFDVFPTALGGIGIPWSLLSDPWLESVRALEQSTESDTTMVFLDRPRRFVDLFLPELTLRFAWMVFREGTYQLRSPPAPNPLRADWDLTELNKAAAKDQTDQLVSTSDVTRDFLVNVIKVQYNRTTNGMYASTLVVRDETSISRYGEMQGATIEAVNSYSDAAGTGASVEALASSLIARVLPAFSRPMRTVSRVIAPTEYDICPGDTVSLSDPLIRNSVSGERGLVSRGCVCMASSRNFGHEGAEMFGEVALLFTDEDRTFPFAPAADVDGGFSGTIDGITFTDGYANTAAGGPAIKCIPYRFAVEIEDLPDVVSFQLGDRVRIYEIDATPGESPFHWDRELPAVAPFKSTANSYLRLTAELVAPAYDPDRQYRVTFQRYSEVTDAQKLFAFQCDTDGLIEDEAEANTYEDDRVRSFLRTEIPGAVRYRLISSPQDDDGRPFHPGLVYDHMVNINNLVQYTCAPQMPMVHFQRHATNLDDFSLVDLFPFYFGLYPTRTHRRFLRVAPILQTTSAAATVSCRVTSSKFPPYGPSGEPARFTGPKKSTTFTRSGTTLEAPSSERSLAIVPADFGITWISVELRISPAGPSVFGRYRGFHTLHLNPIQLAP